MNNTYIAPLFLRKITIFPVIVAILALMGFVGIAEAVSFTTRCNASGVVLCANFDNSQQINPFLYYSDSSVLYGSLDTAIKSSGVGSLKFIIPTNSNANSSGGLPRVIDESGNGYREGDTFYVQFRQRFSPEMLNSQMGGNGWKQMVFASELGWYGDGNPMSIGLFNQNMAGYPVLYLGDETRYFNQNPADGIPITYQFNQWMTFSLRIQVGTWGQPNSSIEGWIGNETTQLKKVFNYTGIVLYNDPANPGLGFNKIDLTTNNTNKSPATVHAQAVTWFDELIVSAQPIADPVDAIPTPTTTPTPGTGNPTVSITSPANGADINGSVLISVSATDSDGIAGVKFYYDNDTPFSYEDRYSPYRGYFYTGGVSAGLHTIHAIATDRLGNSSRASIDVNVVPPPDRIAPYISASSITNITTSEASIGWITNEPADGQIEICPSYSPCGNRTPLMAGLVTQHTINLSGLAPLTKYYIQIISKDASGNSRSAYRQFITADVPDVTSPVIFITSPANGVSISGRVLIQANATDNRKVAMVKFMYDNDIPFGYDDYYAPYSTYLTASGLSLGQHTIHALVRDSSGNTNRTSITVNIVPPPDKIAPYISASVSNITQTSAVVSWTTNELTSSQAEFCTTYNSCGNIVYSNSSMNTQHSFILTGLTPYTSYYVLITARDSAGNVRLRTRAFRTWRVI